MIVLPLDAGALKTAGLTAMELISVAIVSLGSPALAVAMML